METRVQPVRSARNRAMLVITAVVFQGCSGSVGPLPTAANFIADSAATGPLDATPVADSLEPPYESVDLLVIGAGPAGLAAAVEATRQGQSVRVLEARDMREDLL